MAIFPKHESQHQGANPGANPGPHDPGTNPAPTGAQAGTEQTPPGGQTSIAPTPAPPGVQLSDLTPFPEVMGITARYYGPAGKAMHAYVVQAIFPGGKSKPTHVGAVTECQEGLSTSQFVNVGWAPLPGATGYNVFRLSLEDNKKLEEFTKQSQDAQKKAAEAAQSPSGASPGGTPEGSAAPPAPGTTPKQGGEVPHPGGLHPAEQTQHQTHPSGHPQPSPAPTPPSGAPAGTTAGDAAPAGTPAPFTPDLKKARLVFIATTQTAVKDDGTVYNEQELEDAAKAAEKAKGTAATATSSATPATTGQTSSSHQAPVTHAPTA